MNARKPVIADKALTLIESHSWLAVLLAVLCLAFAINYAFFGPGADGGSGLGGTGRVGGESGLGGTGKTPDSGPTFKLGANDRDEDSLADDQDSAGVYYIARRAPEPVVEFDVANLRLSLEMPPAPIPQIPAVDQTLAQTPDMSALVSAIALDTAVPAMEKEMQEVMQGVMQKEKALIFADALVSSEEILNGLMLAESATSLELAGSADNADSDTGIRNRIAMPVRPERPDRLSIPTRVTSVPRTAIPAPPPVRPMRTLSSLLNH